jgi:hypothetical protein
MIFIVAVLFSLEATFISPQQVLIARPLGTNVSGTISQDTIWTATGSPYILTGSIRVLAGIVLTIEPGVTVQSDAGHDIGVEGVLNAVGTATQPIRFSPTPSNERPGFWGGFDVNGNGQLQLEHADVGYTVGAILFNNSNTTSSVTLKNTTVHHDSDYPISVGINNINKLVMEAVTFANNATSRIRLYAGRLSASVTLAAHQAGMEGYEFTGSSTVPANMTMTIQPGVVLYFGSGESIAVEGVLNAVGTAAQPIRFSPTPSNERPGFWGGFDVNNGGQLRLEHVDVGYTVGAILFNNSGTTSSVTLKNTTVHHDSDYPISVSINNINKLAMEAVTFANNATSRIRLYAGRLSASVTLAAHQAGMEGYEFTGSSTVPANMTMTIQPGVVLYFGGSEYIAVEGVLNAVGTATQPIRFSPTPGNERPGFWGGFDVNNGGQLRLEHADVGYTVGAILFNSSNTTSSVTLKNTTVHHDSDYPISVSINNINKLAMEAVTFANNATSRIRLYAGRLSASVTLAAHQAGMEGYEFTGSSTIPANMTMTIQPGVVLYFGGSEYIAVEGVLNAVGTAAQPIRFSPTPGNERPGFWGGIDINGGGQLVLEHVDVGYTVGAILFNNSGTTSSVTLKNTTVHHDSDYPISVSINNINKLAMEAVTFANNATSRIRLYAGRLSASVTLAAHQAGMEGYEFTGSSTVPANMTMTIQPGVVLYFGSGEYIAVEGVLNAVGTAAQPIRFSPTPSNERPGFWGGFDVNNGGQLRLEHADVGYTVGAILFNSSTTSNNITLKNTIIHHDSSWALSFNGQTNAVIQNNSIISNTNGIQNRQPTISIDARNNYWGDPSGPQHPTLNPNGLGNAVSDGVLFDPWLPFPGAEPGKEDIEALTIGESKSFNIEPLKPYYFKLTPEIGKNLVVRLGVTSGLGEQSVVRLLGTGNCVPLPYAFDDGSATTAANGHTEIPISPVTTDEYYLLVYAPFLRQGTVNVTLNSQYTELYVSSVNPNRGGNVGNLTVEVKGTGLSSVKDVVLVGANDHRIRGAALVTSSESSLITTFVLKDQPLGIYKLELHSQNAISVLDDAIEVFAGTAGRLKVWLEGPETVRPNRAYPYKLHYQNVGDNDIDAPFIGVKLIGDQAAIFDENYVSIDSLIWIATGHQPYYKLVPGEQGSINFSVVGNRNYKLEVATIQEDSGKFDWDLIEPRIRITNLSDDYWNTIWTNLRNKFGTTRDEVFRNLRNNHTLGNSAVILEDLFWLEINNQLWELSQQSYIESDVTTASIQESDAGKPTRDNVFIYDDSFITNPSKITNSISNSDSTFDPSKRTIFISHGWKDSSSNERYLNLTRLFRSHNSDEICHNILCTPIANYNIVRIDWKESADFVSANIVSNRIPAVSKIVFHKLDELGFKQWSQSIYIGHSFGNAINAFTVNNACQTQCGHAILLDPASRLAFLGGDSTRPYYINQFASSIAIVTNSVADDGSRIIGHRSLKYRNPHCGSSVCNFNEVLAEPGHAAGFRLFMCLLGPNNGGNIDGKLPCGTMATIPSLGLDLLEGDFTNLGISEVLTNRRKYFIESDGRIYRETEIASTVCMYQGTYLSEDASTMIPNCGVVTKLGEYIVNEQYQQDVVVVRPIDPNDKIGPIGISDQQVVASDTTLNYTINFENMATATAPVQELRITDQLDLNLDWSTFQFNSLSYGDRILALNTGVGVLEWTGQDYPSSTVITGTTEGDMQIVINAKLNIQTGVIEWYLKTIDDATGDFPLDALAGFLPPENGTGRGQGYVTFSIKPKADIAQGTVIKNKASIIFDTNEAIETNEVFNTVGEAADLVLLVKSQETVYSGSTFGTTFTILNDGPNLAKDVALNIAVPGTATLVSATPSQGQCNATTCALGTLEKGSRVTVEVVQQSTVEGQIQSSATVTTSIIEINNVDNHAVSTTSVLAKPNTNFSTFLPLIRR